ncbi:MAG: FkbM family methyltransferase [Flavobacterium sp.]|uniref:FkbM family methyltransferase n=1 Tax=Flavobacterium sp. TaxID=239 RepID=UPI0011FEBCE0|nr:FkbM family methyltransferase [Flavobacterium sp.]RZJ65871.1 MAG: FkbM family methyltransferase [Flavobacterium sp.]
MKRKIKILILSVLKYGFLKGCGISLKFWLGTTKSISIPGIKHPFELRNHLSDVPTFVQVFLENSYEMPIPKATRTIIDAGANVGLFAIRMANQFPDATIICIEPDPENFELLKKNLSPYPNVHFENAGLWDKDTKLRVYDKYDSGKWGMVVEESLEIGTIAAISVPTLIEKYNRATIDLFKIDIETSEKQLFSDNYQSWMRKIKMITIELHDWMEDGCAQPFFHAVHESYAKYKFLIQMENVVVYNQVTPDN